MDLRMHISPSFSGEGEGSAVLHGDSTYIMTKEHEAAFKKVMELKRIIWCDYAAAFAAALECANTKQSQDFAIKFIPYALPFLTGEGDPPQQTDNHQLAQAGSAWDDWCGEYRRKGNHPAVDQTKFFQTALLCAVKLVLHSLDRGSAELISALDTVLDRHSPIYSFRREQNGAAHALALALLAECTAIWKEGGGPKMRLNLLDKAPWPSLFSVVKSIDSTGEAGESSDVLNRVALRIEKANAEEISEACSQCQQLITQFKKENQPAGLSTLLMGFSKSLGFPNVDPRKKFRQRLKSALKQLALRGCKSSVWAQRREALKSLAYCVDSSPPSWASSHKSAASWLEEEQILEDLFGERAHATIVSETVTLLGLIELTDARMNMLVDSALMHVGSVRAEVHKVILAVLSNCSQRAANIVLDRIMGVFDVPDVLKRNYEGTSLGTKPSSPAFAALAKLHSGECQHAAFELVTALFDPSRELVAALFDKGCKQLKSKALKVVRECVSFRALDVLVAALLTPFCEDQEMFSRLVQDSLFHCLQSTWDEDSSDAEEDAEETEDEIEEESKGSNTVRRIQKHNGESPSIQDEQEEISKREWECSFFFQKREHVAHLCCKIVQNKGGATSQTAMKGAFAVLMEVIRLFPRSNFASLREITREKCIHTLQTQFDLLQAFMLDLRRLSQSLDARVMESDDVLQTELWTRLGQLRYLLENTSADYLLENTSVDQLLEALNLNGCSECCLRWLRLAADSGGIFDESTHAHLFRRYICKMDPATMRPHGFNCFQALFAEVNNAAQVWETSGRSGQKSGCKINGPAFVGRRVRVLWKDEKMHNGTICSYIPPSSRDPKTQRHTVRWDDTGQDDTHDWTDLHDWHLLEDESSVNILAYEILSIKKPDSLEGMDFLWKVCLMANDDVVATKAHDMLLDISSHKKGTSFIVSNGKESRLARKGTQLLLAASDGDTATVGTLLSMAGAQSLINYQDARGGTPLYCAAQKGHASVTKQLIEARCNIDLQEKDGATPLFCAAHNGHAAVAGQLIAARCNMDLQTKDGETALQVAQRTSNAGIAMLIRNEKHKGANRAKKDTLQQPSPEEIKKQQEAADRAMTELLDEEVKAAAGASAVSQKKKQAKRAGQERQRQRDAADGQDGSQKEEHAEEQKDTERTEARAEYEKAAVAAAEAEAGVALKAKVEEGGGKEEEERRQEALEKKEAETASQVIQRRRLSQEKDDDDGLAAASSVKKKNKSNKEKPGHQGASASQTAPWATEANEAGAAAAGAGVKAKSGPTPLLADVEQAPSRRPAAEGQDVSQNEEHAKEHKDTERTGARSESQKKKTEIVATSAVAAAPAAPKNKFEKPGEEEEERNQVAAERKEDDAGFQVIQRKSKSKKKNAGDQGASASKTAPWATASKEAGAAAAREGAKSKSWLPPLLAEVEQAGGGDAAAAAGAPLGARLYAISSIMSAGEAESLFWSRFNFLPSDASSRAAETAACTAHLRPAAAPEEAPAPAESMSRAAPAAGAVARFVSESFQCPLTMEVMRDPVITVDGQTYERTEIEKWFALGNRTSPLTREALPSTNLIPNIALRNAIQDAGA